MRILPPILFLFSVVCVMGQEEDARAVLDGVKRAMDANDADAAYSQAKRLCVLHACKIAKESLAVIRG
jgi:hypothetical protein